MVEKSLVGRQEAKIRELESKLEFEKTQVKRLEVSVSDALPGASGRLRRPGNPESRRPGPWGDGKRASPEVRGQSRRSRNAPAPEPR